MDIYEHCAVLVDERQEIAFVYGDTSPYLSLPPGEVGLNILNMISHPLRMDLRALIHKSMRENIAVKSGNIDMDFHGTLIRVVLRIGPARLKGTSSQMTLVVFERAEIENREEFQKALKEGHQEDPRIAELEHDLATAREHLQTTVEELETANEELQSLNEELQSSNEELQSSNEELETSNEELQSTNEELTTVNEEFQVKSSELVAANVDLENILKNVGVAMVIVDKDLRVTRYTPTVSQLINIVTTDIGQIITSIPFNFILKDFREILVKAAIQGCSTEVDIEAQGRIYRLKIIPYLDERNKPFGAMVIFLDIDDLVTTEHALQKSRNRSARLTALNEKLEKEIAHRTKAEKALRETNDLLEKTFDNIHVMIAYMDTDFNYLRVNYPYANANGHSREFFVGKNYFDLHPDNDLTAIFERVIKTKEPHFIFAQPSILTDKSVKQVTYTDMTLQPIVNDSKEILSLLLSIVDVTEREERLSGTRQS